MSYVKNILIAIDQVGNALAGGNPDNTISGKTGYMALNAKSYARWFWLMLEALIDTTFMPFDGWGHCFDAWQKEKDEEFYWISKRAAVVFGLITIICCGILIVPFYLFHLIRWIVNIIKDRKNK
jgi:hypothetical protein